MTARENYHVFLRPDIPPEAVQFFAQFVRKATFKNGASLDYLACSSISTNGRFFEIVAYPPESEKPWPMQIPQNLVLVVSGPIEAKNPIGFITGEGAK
jgi:hypothetical protein